MFAQRLSGSWRFAPVALVLAAACSDNPSSPAATPPATLTAIEAQRIAVSDAASPTLRVLSAGDGAVLQTFTLTGGPASTVNASGSGRFVSVHQRLAGVVEMFDGGVWANGSVAYLQSPAKLSFELRDSLPTYESVNGHWKSIWFDGTGIARWMDERQTLVGAPAVAFQVNTGGPHHAGSSTLETNGAPVFVYTPRNPAGGLPTSIVAVNGAHQELARNDNCPSMHGHGTVVTGSLWGCVDGAVLVRAVSGTVTATKLTPMGELAGLGIRNVWGKGNLPWLVGRLSAPPGSPAQRHLAMVTVATGAIDRLPTPAGVTDHNISVESHSGLIAVLATNGNLYVYNGNNRTLVHTVTNVVPALPTSGSLTHQVATVQGMAAVASPYTGEVVLVNLANGTITRRISVTGQPSRLAILGPSASGTFQRAN